MPLFSPHLGDKLVDWKLLTAAGGQDLVAGKDILELGPSYGLDLMMWAPWAKSYSMIESALDVVEHIEPVIARLWKQKYACSVALHIHNMQNLPFPVSSARYDLVIDFGTVDNVLNGSKPYDEALRALRPGGWLLTTYANFAYFKETLSACGDELRFDPGTLAEVLRQHADVRHRLFEDQPRAAMAVQKR